MRNKSGFSLVEVILAVVLIGMISGLCYPVVNHLLEACKNSAAENLAESFSAAKQSYWMRNVNAQQEYAKHPENEGRYDLIKNYMPDPNLSLKQALSKFDGYKLEMGNEIRDRVSLSKGKNN